MKMEVDAMPKSQRKDAFRMRKEHLDKEQMLKVFVWIYPF